MPRVVAGTHPVWSAGAEEEVGRLFRSTPFPRPRATDQASCQFYFADGVGVTGFDVADGHVVRVALYRSAMTAARIIAARDTVAKMNARRPAPRFEYTGFRGTGESRPAVLIFYLDPVQWYLMVHPEVDAEVAEGLKDKRLVVGMTAREADIAMWGRRRREEAVADGGQRVVWSERVQSGKETVDRPVAGAVLEGGRVVKVDSFE